MRVLASIRAIDDILPIAGADRIELVIVGGWSCIAKKGEFTKGSPCVYFEIDSFLPEDERFSFMGKIQTHQNKVGYRVKTMKMRKVLSQGLALPLSLFPEIKRGSIGEDVTELLKVIKYDVDLSTSNNVMNSPGRAKGSFPSFIPKTDQSRVQNLPHYFRIHKDTEFEETLKLDGSSCTMYKIEREPKGFWNAIKRFFVEVKPEIHFGVCSRNLEIKEPTDSDKRSNFWIVANKYNIKSRLPVGFAIQGEVLASNIQGNYEKVEEPKYYIFNVFDIAKQKYLAPEAAREFVKFKLPEAKYIPVKNNNIKLFTEYTDYDALQTRVDTQSIRKGVVSEGRVYKSIDGKTTFKVINNKYLLKTGK